MCPHETNPQNYFHHAFHEDAKPGDLSLQFPIRWRSSSNQLVTRMNRSGSEATPSEVTCTGSGFLDKSAA